MSSTEQGDFWAKAERPKPSNRDFMLDPSAKPPTSRRKKILFYALGFLFLALIGTVAFLPKILGAFAPRFVPSQASKYVSGEVSVSRASLSWGGPQLIEGLTIRRDGNVLIGCDIEVEAGLLSLARGGADVGTIIVSNADLNLVRDGKGVVNLSTLAKSNSIKTEADSNSGGPASLPEHLNVKLLVEDLDFSYRDLSNAADSVVSIDNIDVRVDVVAGQPLILTVKSKSTSTNIKSDVKVSNWSDGSELQFGRAKVDGTVEISNFPTGAIDAFLPSGQDRPDVRSGFGDVVSLTAALKGSRDQGSADIELHSKGVTFSGGFVVKDEWLSTSSTINLNITGPAIRALIPSVDTALRQSPNVSIKAPPDVAVRVSDVRIPISKGEIKTLRGAGANIELSTSELQGDLQVDDVPKSFRLAPTAFSVRSTDLASGVQGSLATDIRIDDIESGSISMSVSSGSLLDAKGALNAALPKEIRADISVINFSTAVLQPFVATTGLDLLQDVGPTLNCNLKATAGSGTPGQVPPTAVRVELAARELSLFSQFTVDDRGIELAKDSMQVEFKSAGRLLSRFVVPDTGWQIDPATGQATIAVSGLVVPRTADSGWALRDARGAGSFILKNLRVAPVGEAGKPIEIKESKLDCSIDSGKLITDLDASVSVAGQITSIDSSVEVPSLFDSATADHLTALTPVSQWRPTARISVSKLPVEVARYFLPTPESDRRIGMVRGLAGDLLDFTLAARPDQQMGVFGAGFTLTSSKLKSTLTCRLSKDMLSLTEAKITTHVDVATLSSFLDLSKSGIPTISGTSRFDIAVGAFDLPLDATSSPVWSRAGSAVVSIESPGQTVIDGLRTVSSEGVEQDFGRVGFQRLKLVTSLPFQTLFGAGQPDARKLEAELLTTIIGPSKSPLCDLRLKGNVEIESARPVGPLNVGIDVSKIDTKQLESIVPEGALAFAMIGESFDFESSVVITPGKDRSPLNAEQSTIVATNEIRSRGMKTNGPLVFVLSPTAIEIQQDAKIEWQLDPSFVNKLLSSGDTQNASFALSQTADFILTLSSCKLPRSVSSDLNLNCALSSPELRLTDSSGREISMNDLKLNVSTDGSIQNKSLSFSAEVKSAAVDSMATSNPIVVKAKLENLVGKSGAIDLVGSVLSLRAELKAFPTVVVDTLADRKGLLVDLLGDSCDVSASAEKVPIQDIRNLDGRKFSFNLASSRISTSLNGSVTDSVFSTSSPITVSVVEVTNGLTQRFIGAVPVLKKLEKQMIQAPATISEKSLRIPVDSDMRKLNGSVIFDPGEVTYQVNPTLASLLKNSAIRTDGIMGNKLQAATVNFTNGVGVLEKYTLPLGEFSVGLEGKLDLVGQKVEMVVWLPASQLADAVTGKVTALLSAGTTATSDSGTVMSTLLELVPSWPFKVAGPLSSPASSMTLDSERVLEEFKKNGGYKKLIEKIGGSKIKELLKPKDLPIPTVPK